MTHYSWTHKIHNMKKLRTSFTKCPRYLSRQAVVIVTMALLTLLPYEAFSQAGRTITGTVTSASGDPVIGATVSEKGTSNGTITDLKGHYSIVLVSEGSTLVFSFVGMKTREVPVDGKTSIDVKLEENVIGLGEVVAVGYGTMKKSDLTGSVGSVSAEDLNRIPATSLDQSLQGKASGVQITQLSSQPGGTTNIRIRGGNSILGGNQPLVVVDGMPIQTANDQSWISSPELNSLGALNPDDIESIEILKDASATSIYGARGANGVILITTKRGKAGVGKANFQAYYGIQKIAKKIDVMNAAQFATLYDEAGRNAAADIGDTYTPLYPDPQSLGAGTDWQNEIYRTAPQQNYELSFNGGNDRTTYNISTNYYDQDGIIFGSDYKRYSGRLNLDSHVGEKMKVGASLNYSQIDANTVGSSTPGGFFPGVVNTALTMSPVLPVRDSTGQYTLTDPNANAWLDNPVAVTRDVVAKSRTNRMLGSLYGEYSIVKNLSLRVNLGVDQSHNVQDYFNPSYTYSGSFNNGQARYATFESTRLLNEDYLTYDNTFGQHKVNVMAGFSWQKTSTRSFIDIATGYPTNVLSYYGINTAEDKPTVYTGFQDELLISNFARLNYTFKNTYLVTLTARSDGSSKFGPNNKYAFFPSAALAWRLSQEDFIKNLNVFYNLKARISYGISGNDKIPGYQYIPTLINTVYYFNHSVPATGFAPQRPANYDLKWETTRQLDVGLDMGFFGGRISIVTDYYRKRTYDLLYPAQVASMSGFTSALLNVGSLYNRGYELTVNTDNLRGPFSWTTAFNISFNKTVIADLNNNNALFISNDEYKLKIGNWSVVEEGQKLNSFYGLVSDGIWQLDEADQAAVYGDKPGDFKYVDRNQDNQINQEDRTILGSAQPDFIWSLNNTFSYGPFDLTAYINGVYGNKILNANRFELESGNGQSNASIDMLNRWTPDNPSNVYPRANRNADYLHMSDRYLEDGSYVRLQVLTLGYAVPSGVLKHIGVERARIYVSGKNLVTLTKYTGFDPEVGRFGQDNLRQGYDYGGYPAAKTFLVGINLSF